MCHQILNIYFDDTFLKSLVREFLKVDKNVSNLIKTNDKIMKLIL